MHGIRWQVRAKQNGGFKTMKKIADVTTIDEKQIDEAIATLFRLADEINKYQAFDIHELTRKLI